ncbi:hypothetical protein FOL47_006841, partial [Perkinsus chesapeaki]
VQRQRLQHFLGSYPPCPSLAKPKNDPQWEEQWKALLSHISREVAIHRSRESQRCAAQLRQFLQLSDGTPIDETIAAARSIADPSNHCQLCLQGVNKKLARGVDVRALEGLQRRRSELCAELESIRESSQYRGYLEVRDLLQELLDTGSPRRSSGATFEQYVCLDDAWLKKAVAYRLGVQDCSQWELVRNAPWVDDRGEKCGEVDCGIVTRKRHLVAVIECKAGCLQIAMAATQQQRHLSGSSPCTLLLRDGTRAVPSSDCTVFVATTLPHRRFGIGVEPHLLGALSWSLTRSNKWTAARNNTLTSGDIEQVLSDAQRKLHVWCRGTPPAIHWLTRHPGRLLLF